MAEKKIQRVTSATMGRKSEKMPAVRQKRVAKNKDAVRAKFDEVAAGRADRKATYSAQVAAEKRKWADRKAAKE